MSMSDRGSRIVGIDIEHSTITTFGIAGALAGMAGLFFGMSQGVSYHMGLDPLLTAFAIVVLGGMGSIKGSVIAAYIVGTLETVTVTVISAQLTGVAALIVLFFAFIVRPRGLFGRAAEE
jgi:branched-chain amino acid transport system permease protein